ncbi:MAG: AAA family ATPase [Bacteroidota bacterium]
MAVLAVFNPKGGVGKTTTAVNMGYHAARAGYQTLLWDLDPQGASTFYLRVKPKVKGGAQRLLTQAGSWERSVKESDVPHLDLLPADWSYRHLDLDLSALKRPEKRLAKALKPATKAYDVLILDCPATFSLLSDSIVRAADALLVPLIPTPLSLRTWTQMKHYLKEHARTRTQVLPFLTMIDRRKRIHREVVDTYAGGQEGFLTTTIPYASTIERMGVERAPLGTYDRRSRAATAYRALWQEVAARLFSE